MYFAQFISGFFLSQNMSKCCISYAQCLCTACWGFSLCFFPSIDSSLVFTLIYPSQEQIQNKYTDNTQSNLSELITWGARNHGVSHMFESFCLLKLWVI